MKEELNVQGKPFVVKIELTEGCNFWCDFCAIRSIRKKPRDFKFMSVEVVREIICKLKHYASEVKGFDKIRFEIAMHGEPLFNPCCVEILKLIRDAFPFCSILLMSNGGAILEKKVDIREILKYVNVLALDDYGKYDIVKGILEKVVDFPVCYYPEFNIYQKHHWNLRCVVCVSDIQKGKVGVRSLHNTAGNSGPLSIVRVRQRCYRPFKELVFNYLGDVLLCCNDWKGEFTLGNIFNNNINELWNHSDLISARKILFHKGRVFSICYGCNAFSPKNGLLPDGFAKFTMGLPNEKDFENVKKYSRRK